MLQIVLAAVSKSFEEKAKWSTNLFMFEWMHWHTVSSCTRSSLDDNVVRVVAAPLRQLTREHSQLSREHSSSFNMQMLACDFGIVGIAGLRRWIFRSNASHKLQPVRFFTLRFDRLSYSSQSIVLVHHTFASFARIRCSPLPLLTATLYYKACSHRWLIVGL